MKILMLAPHPFYQERGTPIAVDLLLKALSEQGHDVDIVTFAEGQERSYRGVNFFRVKGFFGPEGIRPGFSLAKLYLDIFVFFQFFWLLFTRRYDAVHAIEESAFMAALLCPIRRVPYVYDMDSSMVTQLIDKSQKLKSIEGFLRFLESIPARFAKVVVPCCEALADDTRKFRKAEKPTVCLKDISLLDKSSEVSSTGLNVRDLVGSSSKSEPKVLMYIGNLESYQGIDLMVTSFAKAHSDYPESALVVVGGEKEHIELYQKQASDLGVGAAVYFVGKQPVADLNALMIQSDVLLSPRTQGVNTPMKVYSYLDSGVPVLATRLPTHTQVMTDDTSLLVDADETQYGEGMVKLMSGSDLSKELSENALALIAESHSWPAFYKSVEHIYSEMAR